MVDLHFFCLCISLAPAWIFVVKEDYNNDKTVVMKLISMICKFSPFFTNFGDINNCFCNKELKVFQEAFQYIFLMEVQYWQARNMGGRKTRTFVEWDVPLNLCIWIPWWKCLMSSKAKILFPGGQEELKFSAWSLHAWHFYSSYSSLQPCFLSSTVTFITFSRNIEWFIILKGDLPLFDLCLDGTQNF